LHKVAHLVAFIAPSITCEANHEVCLASHIPVVRLDSAYLHCYDTT
jgi:hypothetical protein